MKKLLLFVLLLCSSAFGQIAITNVDDLTSGDLVTNCNTLSIWCAEHDTNTAGTSTGTTAMVTTPALDGHAREFDFSWTALGGHRFHANVGSTHLDGTSTYFTLQLSFRFTDLTHVNSVEFDSASVRNNGHTTFVGVQCNFVTGFWEYKSNVSGTATWNASSATCSTTDFLVNVWHNLLVNAHITTTGDVSYDLVTLDTNKQGFGTAIVDDTFTLSDTPVGRQYLTFQVDGDNSAHSTIAYLDSVGLISEGFSDDFSTGTLDPARWVCDTGNAPGNIVNVNVGTWDCSHFDLTQGMLDISLTQTGTAPTHSIGGELRSIARFGYGEYHFKFRAASTATTPAGTGSCVSGQISTGFLFFTNSQMEIDVPEIQGQTCNNLEWTNYFNGPSNNASFITTLTNPHNAQHDYSIIWIPGSIKYYVDGTLVGTATTFIPTAPGWVMASLWGTNSTGFGGLATPGTVRHEYFSLISFTPIGNAPPPPTGLGASVL